MKTYYADTRYGNVTFSAESFDDMEAELIECCEECGYKYDGFDGFSVDDDGLIYEINDGGIASVGEEPSDWHIKVMAGL